MWTWWDWSLILRTITSFSALTVGWVIWPAKTVPEMTYNVFSGTLNPTHFTSLYARCLPSQTDVPPKRLVFSTEGTSDCVNRGLLESGIRISPKTTVFPSESLSQTIFFRSSPRHDHRRICSRLSPPLFTTRGRGAEHHAIIHDSRGLLNTSHVYTRRPILR